MITDCNVKLQTFVKIFNVQCLSKLSVTKQILMKIKTIATVVMLAIFSKSWISASGKDPVIFIYFKICQC